MPGSSVRSPGKQLADGGLGDRNFSNIRQRSIIVALLSINVMR